MVKNIICMKWGTLYSPDYVNKLYYSVKRNISGDFRFVCFTDDIKGIIPEVETKPLPEIKLPYPDSVTGWQKISVWQNPLYDITGDVLFLDIDIVITGNIDDLFTYLPNEFVVIDNWTQIGQNIGNTSVFRFPVGRFSHVYNDLMENTDHYLKQYRIEQQYVSAKIPEQKFWPSEWIISFKHSCLPKFPMNLFIEPPLPQNAKIVAFHGKPDPIDAMYGKWPAPWYKRFYKQVKPTQWIATHWKETL